MATAFYETKSLLTVICRRNLASPKLATYLAGDPRADPSSPWPNFPRVTLLENICLSHTLGPVGLTGITALSLIIPQSPHPSLIISRHLHAWIQGTQMMKLPLVFIESSDAREYNYTPPLNHTEVRSTNLPPSWKSVYNFSLPPNLAAYNLLLTLPMT